MWGSGTTTSRAHVPPFISFGQCSVCCASFPPHQIGFEWQTSLCVGLPVNQSPPPLLLLFLPSSPYGHSKEWEEGREEEERVVGGKHLFCFSVFRLFLLSGFYFILAKGRETNGTKGRGERLKKNPDHVTEGSHLPSLSLSSPWSGSRIQEERAARRP